MQPNQDWSEVARSEERQAECPDESCGGGHFWSTDGPLREGWSHIDPDVLFCNRNEAWDGEVAWGPGRGKPQEQ